MTHRLAQQIVILKTFMGIKFHCFTNKCHCFLNESYNLISWSCLSTQTKETWVQPIVMKLQYLRGIYMITLSRRHYLPRCGRGRGSEGGCGTAFRWRTPSMWSLRGHGWTATGGTIGGCGVGGGLESRWDRGWFPIKLSLWGIAGGKHGRGPVGWTPEQTILLVITCKIKSSIQPANQSVCEAARPSFIWNSKSIIINNATNI